MHTMVTVTDVILAPVSFILFKKILLSMYFKIV